MISMRKADEKALKILLKRYDINGKIGLLYDLLCGDDNDKHYRKCEFETILREVIDEQVNKQ